MCVTVDRLNVFKFKCAEIDMSSRCPFSEGVFVTTVQRALRSSSDVTAQVAVYRQNGSATELTSAEIGPMNSTVVSVVLVHKDRQYKVSPRERNQTHIVQ